METQKGHELPKKQETCCLYQKKNTLPRNETHISPLGSAQIGQANQMSHDDIQRLKNKVSLSRAEHIKKQNDMLAVQEEVRVNGGTVLKKMKLSPFSLEDMDRIYKGTTRKWTDPDFNYQKISIGRFNIQWHRPQDFIYQPLLFPPQITPNDVIQGWINNCYFLSAVACLCQKPHRIIEIFEIKQYNPNGYYICNLTFDGIYQQVIVDDLFPTLGGINADRLVYARPAQKRYIWVMVLEKCWAKLLKGYSNTNFGYTSEAFQALTGAPTSFGTVSDYITERDPKAMALFDRLKYSDEKQWVTQISTENWSNEMQKNRFEKEYGLPLAHAYSLLGVYETKLKNGNTAKLVQIRNPWGDQDAKNIIWNDKDPRWNQVIPSEKERMLFRYNKTQHDGVFYMQWSDLVKFFPSMISTCQINDEAHYLFSQLTFHQRTVKYLELSTNGRPEEIGLTIAQEMEQHFMENYKYCDISVILCQIQEDSSYQVRYRFIKAETYYSNRADNYFTLSLRQLPKGRYMIRVFAVEPEYTNRTIKLTVGVYSPAIVGLRVKEGVDDESFLKEICRPLAMNHPKKVANPSDPSSWFVRDFLPGTNLGYIMFHHDSKSIHPRCGITFNQMDNPLVHFMFEFFDKKFFTLTSNRGSDIFILFGFCPPGYRPEVFIMVMEHMRQPKMPTPRLTVI